MSDEPNTSKLTVITTKKKEKKLLVTVVTKKGSVQQPVRGLSSDLMKETVDNLESMEVEYEMDKGLVSKVWKKGGTWQSEANKTSFSTPPPRKYQKRDRYDKPPRQQGSNKKQFHQPLSQMPEAFHNPYNFVPALPRHKEEVNQTELGDHEPQGHHAYHPDHWSGWIEVQLTTATPLLIPDAAQVSTNNDDHKTFPVRVNSNGAPYLPPTSLKGMLRSAYEAVTNSRLSIFEKHEDRLAYRMNARKGVEMVPAVVEKNSVGLQLRLLSNSITIGSNGAPQNKQMYAAWLPRYQKYYPNAHYHQDKHEIQKALRYPDNTLPQHGELVWVRCEQQQHHSKHFSFSSVTSIRQRTRGQATPTGYQPGIVCITGRNMMNKHEERVFLLSPNDPRVDLTPSLIEGWKTLIKNYQSIHTEELQKRTKEKHQPNEYLGHEPGKTGWSHHIYTKDAVYLKEDALCYVRVEHHNTNYKVLGLYPVMISRDLFKESPADLLHASLHPAVNYKELSPADRVFGWVNHKGNGAWKGQLRIEPAECKQGTNAIEHFGEDGIPLAILGEAKPQQTHFYAAHNWQGEPLPDGKNKSAGYQERTQGLRGRKMYPHHAHLASLASLHSYWLKPKEDRTQQPIVHQSKKYYQEYRRPTLTEKGKDKTRDNQNRSVLGWIKPETAFRFKIHLSNLSNVELGALLWLLHLDDNYYHRLGSSKPLGFGSVRLQIHNMELRNGQDWAAFYQNFLSTDISCLRNINDVNPYIDVYKKAVENAYGKPFEHVSFIKAFKIALRGFDNGLPMHYPRTDEKPNPKGESFKWFVENEKSKGPQLALPSIEGQHGLPLLKAGNL